MICDLIAKRCVSKQLCQLIIINACNRGVHSTNRSEIDYLMFRYRLNRVEDSRKPVMRSNHANASLAYFDTIDNYEYKSTKDSTVDCLQLLLGINKKSAKQLVTYYPIIAERSNDELETQVKQLLSMSLTIDDCLHCPWILYFPISLIGERLCLIRDKLFTTPVTNDHLVLMLFPPITFGHLLSKYFEFSKSSHLYATLMERLNYFTESLQLNHEEFCDLLHDNTFLFTYRFDKLKDIMNLLLDSGVDPIGITSDIHVFKHNINVMKERIEECKNCNMQVKTWMLRCPYDAFATTLKRHIDNKNVMKNFDDNIDYLSSHLNCERNIIVSMFKRYPRLIRTSATKLSQIIGFLFENGFTSYHIVDKPKIFYHSVNTILKRKSQLSKLNLLPYSLSVFTLTKEEFNDLVNKLRMSSDSETDRETDEENSSKIDDK